MAAGSTKECLDDPEFYRFLGGTLGRDDEPEPLVFALPCDTMIVQTGVTVHILPNTYIAFKDPNPRNAIVVRGRMVVEGGKARKVHFSSSLDAQLFSPESQSDPWKGIVVDSGGGLHLENVVLHGAEVPISSESPDLTLRKIFFYNARELRLPGERTLSLQSKPYWDEFNAQAYLARVRALEQNTSNPDSLAANGSGNPPEEQKLWWKSPWLYTGAAAVVMAGGLSWMLATGTTAPREVRKGEVEVLPTPVNR